MKHSICPITNSDTELSKSLKLNLGRVENAVITTLDRVPPGSLVVPIDDDDWLSPNLSEKISSELEDGKVGYHWHRDFMGMPATNYVKFKLFIKMKVLGRPRLKWTCSTNKYLITTYPKPSVRRFSGMGGVSKRHIGQPGNEVT